MWTQFKLLQQFKYESNFIYHQSKNTFIKCLFIAVNKNRKSQLHPCTFLPFLKIFVKSLNDLQNVQFFINLHKFYGIFIFFISQNYSNNKIMSFDKLRAKNIALPKDLQRLYAQKKQDFLLKIKNLPDCQQMAFSDGFYIGQINSNKMRHGKGLFKYQSGDIYLGSWKQDFFHGQGIYIFSSGQLYDGSLKNGMKDGKGIYYYDNGHTYYDGSWKNDEKHGYGVFNSVDEYYEGQWQLGKKQGKGHYINKKTKDSYQGSFAHNRCNGKGKMVYGDGSVYEGTFYNDLPDGVGNLQFANKDRYEGHFKQGRKEGEGAYFFSQGTVFEGSWEHNLKLQGRLKLFNGDIFKGIFKNNQRYEGYYQYKNGDIYEGFWLNDCKHGKGKLILKNGQFYQGDFFQGEKHGAGIYRWKNGDVYYGRFQADKREGEGIYKWSEGGIYKGQWKADRMNGWGKITKGGSIIIGYFFADKLMHNMDEELLQQNQELYNYITSQD